MVKSHSHRVSGMTLYFPCEIGRWGKEAILLPISRDFSTPHTSFLRQQNRDSSNADLG